MLSITLTFLLTSLGAFILLWALGSWVQSYLYESVVNDLALRSAIGGIVIGGFYTTWTYINTRADYKDRYGVLQEFSPTAAKPIGEFTATRVYPRQTGADGQPKREEVTFIKTVGSRVATFRSKTNQLFRVSDSMFLTKSITIKDGEQSVVLNAMTEGDSDVYVRPNGRSPRFMETGGKRFVEADEPGMLFIPNTAVLVGALTLNILNFVIWVLVFWLVMRFTLGHSVGGAIGFGAIMMLLFVPLLFQQNEIKRETVTPDDKILVIDPDAPIGQLPTPPANADPMPDPPPPPDDPGM